MNWKTLSDIKNEHMGHGEKVQSTHEHIAVHLHTKEGEWLQTRCFFLICTKRGGVSDLFKCKENKSYLN